MHKLLMLSLVALLLAGCHKAPAEAAAPADGKAASAKPGEGDVKKGSGASDTKGADRARAGVTLNPAEIEAMGIETTPAQPIQSAPEVQGFGVVLAHETIAAAVAEVATAAAAERQSRAALERSHRLAGTPGALPAETQESAQRQAIADQAALELARQKLSSSFGLNPPWKKSDNNTDLRALASGRLVLVRVTFPLGLLGDTEPDTVRLTRIDGSRSWPSKGVWHAPADPTVPGQSYFAIVAGGETREGDHLLAWTPVGEPQSGVGVPASAAVISNGRFYCYVEEKPGTFVRAEFDPSRLTAAGYFVKDGIAAGDRIVTHAAGQLLARETNSGKEPE